jgi:hypothetical protein
MANELLEMERARLEAEEEAAEEKAAEAEGGEAWESYKRVKAYCDENKRQVAEAEAEAEAKVEAEGRALWKRRADRENERNAQAVEYREAYWRKRRLEKWEAEMDEVRAVEDRKRLKLEMMRAVRAKAVVVAAERALAEVG